MADDFRIGDFNPDDPLAFWDRLSDDMLDLVDRLALAILDPATADEVLPDSVIAAPGELENARESWESAAESLRVMLHAAKHAQIDPLSLMMGLAMSIICDSAEGPTLGMDDVLTAFTMLLATVRADEIVRAADLILATDGFTA